MGRPRRIDIRNGVYHVMNRGVNRQVVFFGDTDRVEFGRLLGEIHDRFGVVVHAYCLMPNHYHCILCCPDGGLSPAMQHLGAVFTRHVNDRVGRDGPLFRGRFHSIPIDTDRYHLRAVRYIHRNPLELKVVDDCADYRWSSHRTYRGDRRQPTWLATERVLAHFGGDRSAFDRFVRSDGPIAQPMVETAAELVSIVSLVVATLDLGPEPGQTRSLVNAVLLLVRDELPCDVQRSVDDILAFPSPSAMRMARMRAQRRLAAQPPLAAALAVVRSELGLARQAAA